MVSYSDLEEQNLGRQAKIHQEATNQITEQAGQMQEENAIAEQELAVQAQGNNQEAAMNVISEMQLAEQNGQDPMALLESLPEELQNEVLAIIQGEMAQEQAQGNPNDGTMAEQPQQPQQELAQAAAPQQF